MIVTADEVNRSFRGTLDLLNSRAEGLRSFDMSERGFWHSFTALWLTLPAYVVSLAFERLRLGLLQPDRSLLDNVWVDLVVAFGHVAGFVASGRDDLDRPLASAREGLCALRHRDELDLGHRHAGALGAGACSCSSAGRLRRSQACSASPSRSSSSGCNGSPPRSTLGLASLPALGIVVLGIVLNSFVGTAMRGLSRLVRIIDADQVEARRRGHRAAALAVSRVERRTHILHRPAPGTDPLQRSRHRAHLMVQERAGGGIDADLVADPLHIEPVERADRAVGLAFGRPERGEVVPPDQQSARPRA